MAYLRRLDLRCSVQKCSRRALVEVFDRWNGSRGLFCEKCGEIKKEQMDKIGI